MTTIYGNPVMLGGGSVKKIFTARIEGAWKAEFSSIYDPELGFVNETTRIYKEIDVPGLKETDIVAVWLKLSAGSFGNLLSKRKEIVTEFSKIFYVESKDGKIYLESTLALDSSIIFDVYIGVIG